MALSGNQTTGLRPAFVGGAYAAFVAKALSDTTITLSENVAYEVFIENRNGTWHHTRIVFTGTDFGII